MAQESLLQMLEVLASKVSSLEREKSEAVAKTEALEREKNEAVATARALEREDSELRNLICLAEAKVDEVLNIGADDQLSQPPAVNVTVEKGSATAKGTIRKLVKGRGYGFIRAEDGKDLFFHQNELQGVDLASLKAGQNVEFEVGTDLSGRPAAVNVSASII